MGGGPFRVARDAFERLVLGLAVAGFAFSPAVRASDDGAEPALSVEDRLRQLEAANRAIIEQNRQLLEREARQRDEALARYRLLEQRYEELKSRMDAGAGASPAAEPARTGAGYDRFESTLPELAEGSLWHVPPEAGAAPPARWSTPLRAHFDEGFQLSSHDEEFELRLRVLDQTDFKDFVPNNQFPAKSGLYIPRVRVYFEGRLSKLFDYEVSLQRSVDGVWDLLDANLRINPSRGFQVLFGRQLVPYSFDWYDHLEQYFLTPERALFPLNFGLSREAGLLARGFLFDDRLQYAVGGFDGRLVGVADNNNTRDAVAYFNARPFLNTERFEMLRYLNVGASGFVGQQVGAQNPLPIRTSLQSSENDEAANQASSEILQFREDVSAYGQRQGGALHLAWYHRQFSLESEFNAGRFQFVRSEQPNDRPVVPIWGFHVGAGYFVTGEEVTGRTTVDPLRPLLRRPGGGVTGLGAIELFARYSQLTLSPLVFQDGLADPNAWTRQAFETDIGWNWYLNRYIKFYFDWQHVGYSTPVLLNPGSDFFSRNNDLFWVRCQIYF
jgi:phosphate-selective porin OprO/OprP